MCVTRDSVSVSQSVSRSMMCFFGAKHVIMSQSASQSVARKCVLSSRRDSVSVSQSVSRSMMCFFGAKHVIMSQSASQSVAR